MQEIKFTINGIPVTGQSGNTILEVAQKYGIAIPTLCHDRYLHPYGACRVCIVEDENRGTLHPACITPAAEGMNIWTDSVLVRDTRAVIVKLMIASHPDSCLVCEKGNRCALRQVAADLGIGRIEYYPMPHYTGTREANPFLLRDLSKCILCAKCIRADHELVVEGAIDYLERGFDARPATVHDGPLELSECTFCGTCLELCPTGALFEHEKPRKSTSSQKIATTCPLCACGCAYELEVSDNYVVGVRSGLPRSPNGVTLCVKGRFGYELVNHPHRLEKPLMRKDGELVATSWENALTAAATGIKDLITHHGPDSVAILCSPHCTNEEAFLLRHLSSRILQTTNLCCNTGMDMGALIDGMRETLGWAGSRHTFHDIEGAGSLLLIGTNPPASAPLLSYTIKRAIRNNRAHLVVIDPIENKLCRHASVWLRPKPATDEMVLWSLLGAIMQELSGKNPLPGELKEITRLCQQVSPENVENTTGIPFGHIKEAARLFCAAEKKVIVFGNGIIQQPRGKNLVRTICTISCLVERLTDREVILFPVLKQSNAIGCMHIGLLDHKTPETIFQEILANHIKGLWIVGDDPTVNLPGAQQILTALDKLEVLIVSDSFLSSTAKKAHVVFPVATFSENAGSITNMENRVQYIRPAMSPIGESLPGWMVISQIAHRLGTTFDFRSPQEILQRIIAEVPAFTTLTLPENIAAYSSHCLSAPKTPAKSVLYIPHTIEPISLTEPNYPLLLTTGSILFQLEAGHITSYSRRLSRITTDEYVELNAADASQMSISDHECIKLVSPSGEKLVKARCTERIPRGMAFLPLPFTRRSTVLPFSATGSGFKSIKIRIEKVSS